jgi:hypothetical protein
VSLARQLCWLVLLGGFAWGTFTHGSDFLRYGWAPYQHGTPPINLFWNALLFLDLTVFILLVTGIRKAGLLLALVVMIADVTINAYAATVKVAEFGPAVAIQAAFLGFIVGSMPMFWFAPERESAAKGV